MQIGLPQMAGLDRQLFIPSDHRRQMVLRAGKSKITLVLAGNNLLHPVLKPAQALPVVMGITCHEPEFAVFSHSAHGTDFFDYIEILAGDR